MEDKVQVMHARSLAQTRRIRLETLQAARLAHLDGAQQWAILAVNAHLDARTRHSCQVVTQSLGSLAQIHTCHLDVLTIVDVGHQQVAAVVRRHGLQSVTPGHRLGLYASIGVEGLDLFQHVVHPIGHLLDASIGVVVHLSCRHAALLMVTEGLQVHQVVVQAEDVRLALVVDDTRVIAACTPGAVHNVSHRTPRSRRLVAHRITDAFGAAGRGKGQVPVLAVLIQPGAFLIVVDMVVEFVYLALQRNHILVEQCPIGVRVAPVQIGLSVVVNPNCRVDVVPVFLLPKQGFSQRIDERSIGRISHQHTDAVSVNRTVHVELSVPFDHLLGPGTVVVVVPLEVLQRSHCTVVGPVHHVGRSVEQPVLHHEAVGTILVMRCIKEDRVVIDHRSRVGCVFRLDDGQVHGRIELPPVQVE